MPGTPITNDNATTSVPSNYEECQQTGFRQHPNSLKVQWDKLAVRSKSFDSKHPQLMVSSGSDFTRRGPKRPEANDRFVGTEIDEVLAEDL